LAYNKTLVERLAALPDQDLGSAIAGHEVAAF